MTNSPCFYYEKQGLSFVWGYDESIPRSLCSHSSIYIGFLSMKIYEEICFFGRLVVLYISLPSKGYNILFHSLPYYPKLSTSSSALRWSLASLTSIISSISSPPSAFRWRYLLCAVKVVLFYRYQYANYPETRVLLKHY